MNGKDRILLKLDEVFCMNRILLFGLLALSMLVMSCTDATLAGEATRTADAQRCPNGCDIIKNLNRASMIEYISDLLRCRCY